MNPPREPVVYLVRHLATDTPATPRLDHRGFGAWLASEGTRGITAESRPPEELVELVSRTRHLLVSPLARAQATATAVLGRVDPATRPEIMTVADLREAPLPALPVPWVRLPLAAWGFVCRTAWFLGYAGQVESRRAATIRARRVAARLDELARTGTVTVIAHGIINLLVARELRRLGWVGPRLPDHSHGGTSIFRRPERP